LMVNEPGKPGVPLEM